MGGLADLPFETKVEPGLNDIANRSFGYDLRVMALTVPALLAGRGAH